MRADSEKPSMIAYLATLAGSKTFNSVSLTSRGYRSSVWLDLLRLERSRLAKLPSLNQPSQRTMSRDDDPDPSKHFAA